MKLPKVSCICITRNRRVFLRQALHYFERAAYEYMALGGSSELVILDGSNAPQNLEKLKQNCSRCSWVNFTYTHRETMKLRAGVAHNEACELAGGDIIIQWDDDDWQSPERIVKQVEKLMTAPGDAFTYTSAYYWYHIETEQAVKARSWLPAEGSTGATFAFWKDTWKKTPFLDVAVGEDIPFFSSLKDRGCPMLDTRDPTLLVYMRHNQNGSAMTNYQWNEKDTHGARILLDIDLDFYDGLSEILPVAQWNHPNSPGSRAHVMSPIQQQWLRHFR